MPPKGFAVYHLILFKDPFIKQKAPYKHTKSVFIEGDIVAVPPLIEDLQASPSHSGTAISHTRYPIPVTGEAVFPYLIREISHKSIPPNGTRRIPTITSSLFRPQLSVLILFIDFHIFVCNTKRAPHPKDEGTRGTTFISRKTDSLCQQQAAMLIVRLF